MPSKKVLETGEVVKFVSRERVNKDGQKETHQFGILTVDGCVNTEVLFHMEDVDVRFQRIWQPRRGDVVVFRLSNGYKRLYANDLRPKIYAGTCTRWNTLVKGKRKWRGALTCSSLSYVLLYHDELVNTEFLRQGDRVRFAVNVRVSYDEEGQEIRRYEARMVRLLKEKDDSSSSCSSSSTSSSTSMMSASSSTSSKVSIVRRSSKKISQFADKRTKSSPSFSRTSFSSTPSESSFSFGLSSSQSGEFWGPRKPSQPTSRPPTPSTSGPSPPLRPSTRRPSRRSNSSYNTPVASRRSNSSYNTPVASRSPSPPPVVNPYAYGSRTHINVRGTVTFVDPILGAFGFLHVKNLQDYVVDNENGVIDEVNGKDKKGGENGRKVWFSASQHLGRAKVMVKRRAKVKAKAVLKAGDFVIADLCCNDGWRKASDNGVAVNIRRDYQAEIQRISAQITINHKAAPKTLKEETYLKKELKSLRKELEELRVEQKKDQLGDLIEA